MVLDIMEEVEIRAMDYRDQDAIVGIDAKVLGKSRPDYWQMKIELSKSHSPMASLVAEAEGKVVGFILGDASGWEYGVPHTVGWIDTIGVHPDFQKRGIARALLMEMVDNLKKVGVDTIYTFVNWRDWGLLQFFDAIGFQRGDMINLELKI